jgi:hypothetical protein
VLVGREDASGEARGARRDVTVGGDEALGDRADGLDDLCVTIGGDGPSFSGPRSAVEMGFSPAARSAGRGSR